MVSNIVATYNTRSDSPGRLYVNFFNLDTLSYISDEWFNQVIKNFGESYSYGAINGRNRAIVGKIKENDSNRIEYEENILDLNGNLICSNWYDKIEFKEKKYGIVLKNELKNIIVDDNDIIGLISPDLWFNEIYTYNGRIFCDGWADVQIGKGSSCYNFINPDGKFLLKKGVDYAHPFREGFAKIRKNKKFNLLRTDGSLLSPNLWFDDITPVSTVDEERVYAYVKNDDKFNFISKNGQLLTDVWFDKVGRFAFFQTDYTVCRLGHESYILYLDGTLKKVKDELGENTIRKIVSETVRHLLAEMDR